ncbi:MAG: three-Cys-motif partner protein TcmP [Candidatus Angelobacter sp.]
MRTPEFYKGKEQTYVKHFFLEKYLETVALHIGFSYPRFVYVDGFSGPWRAEGEDIADTSFWIALNRLNYVRKVLAAKGKEPHIKAVFVERLPSTFTSLQRAIQECRGDIDVVSFPGTFEDNIPKILGSVKHSFSFFFIDPTGWTGFGMEAIKPILQHTPGEVMINFMYDYINRFLNSRDPKIEAQLDALFGTKTWRSLRETQDREYAIVDFYREQIRAAGNFQFVTSTRILKPTHDRAYYHLIYATRNPKGITEFRTVEKKTVAEQEQVRWTAKRQVREDRSGQSELDLEPIKSLETELNSERSRQMQRAQDRILNLLQLGPDEYDNICPRILELPLVWESDLKSILLRMRDDKQIHIDGMGLRGRVPKAGCRLRLI